MREEHGITNRSSTVFGVLVALAALAALTAPAGAAEAQFGAELLVCDACHGANGVPKNPTIPIIWGQQENYVLKQLHDFKSGARSFEVMAWMTTNLVPGDLEQAAPYFAKKGWPARRVAVAATTPPAGVALCQVCHAQNYAGGPIPGGLTAPRLAGQNYEYLVETMRRYAEGERTNNVEMTTVMGVLSVADREAMARYLSGR
jgi:cytochrome c553